MAQIFKLKVNKKKGHLPTLSFAVEKDMIHTLEVFLPLEEQKTEFRRHCVVINDRALRTMFLLSILNYVIGDAVVLPYTKKGIECRQMLRNVIGESFKYVYFGDYLEGIKKITRIK